MTCVSDRFERGEELARTPLIDGKVDRSIDGLRWSPVGLGSGLESTRHKGIHVVFRRPLDVVPEETVHGDCLCATLVPLGDSVLTSVVLSGSGSGRVGVNDGFEARHIDRWYRVSRIVQHPVVDGNKAVEYVAIRQISDCEKRFNDGQFC